MKTESSPSDVTKGNLYVIIDKVANTPLGVISAPTDGSLIQQHMAGYAATRPMDEFQIVCIGMVDWNTKELLPCDHRIVKNDAYKFPEAKTRPLSEEEIMRLASAIQKNTVTHK